MEIKLTEKEALALYRIIIRWDENNAIEVKDHEEQQLLWDLHCLLEKELEPVDENVTRRITKQDIGNVEKCRWCESPNEKI